MALQKSTLITSGAVTLIQKPLPCDTMVFLLLYISPLLRSHNCRLCYRYIREQIPDMYEMCRPQTTLILCLTSIIVCEKKI